MLCSDCLRVAVPDTVLGGTDLGELLGWCCLAVPGLLYCAWRHLNRLKACPHCASPNLIREARAADARRWPIAAPATGRRIRTLSPAIDWPRALRDPRDRLRRGSVATGLLVLAIAAHAAGTAPLLAVGSSALCLVWVAHQLIQISRMRATLPGCRAWDQHGRPLRIEQI